jgi:membrane protease YdiL (CAAX protease family)
MTAHAPAAGTVRPHLAVVHIAIVYLAVRAFWTVSAMSWVSRQPPVVETLAKVALWVVPCVLLSVLTIRQSPRASWRDLGLGGAPWRALAFGLAATAPMAVALAFTPIRPADFDLLLDTVVVGPFAEEVLFRGFLCFQLVRLAGWRIGTAIAVSSTMFALAHLPHIDLWLVNVFRGPVSIGLQSVGGPEGRTVVVVSPLEVWGWVVSHRLDEVLRFGAPYALGGALFAWVAWRWQSLWPAVGLHACMNLWWALAQGESRLQFDVTPMTVAHTAAIALAIGLTLAWPRRESGTVSPLDGARRADWTRLVRSDTR